MKKLIIFLALAALLPSCKKECERDRVATLRIENSNQRTLTISGISQIGVPNGNTVQGGERRDFIISSGIYDPMTQEAETGYSITMYYRFENDPPEMESRREVISVNGSCDLVVLTL